MSDINSAFDELLSTTRSVRRRIDFDRAIDPSLLLEAVDVAVQAPTGVGDETWRFLVVTDARKKDRLAALYRKAFDDYMALRLTDAENQGIETEELSPNYRFLAERLQDFPALVLVCSEGRPPAESSRRLAFYGSILPAAWSLMLAMRNRGLGATWTTLLSSYEKQTAEILDIPDDVTPTVLLPVGHMKGAKLRRANRRSAQEITFWNGWGETSE